jgi:hypothetical protein
MASDHLKAQIAREIAHGERIAEVARRHGYSWKGMQKLVRNPDVEALIAQEREALDEAAERYRAELVLCGDTAIENVRRVVEDPDHPRNLDTSRWLLDKILPSKNQAPSVAIALQTESRYAEVAEEIAAGLKLVNEKYGKAERAGDLGHYCRSGRLPQHLPGFRLQPDGVRRTALCEARQEPSDSKEVCSGTSCTLIAGRLLRPGGRSPGAGRRFLGS